MTDTAPADPQLIAAWLAARSVARALPAPVADRGGWRVDTGGPVEIVRWVFPAPVDGLAELAREITAPGRFIKLLAGEAALAALVPDRWQVQPPAWFMTTTAAPAHATLPAGYTIVEHRSGGRTHVRILGPDGDAAASGYAAETAAAFVYDRIRTEPAHRRRGLGRALIATLGRVRAGDVPQLLTATPDGRALYRQLGWSELSSYSTVTIPA